MIVSASLDQTVRVWDTTGTYAYIKNILNYRLLLLLLFFIFYHFMLLLR